MNATSHCTKHSRQKLQGRSAIGALLIIVAVSLMGWVYLSQASFVATTNRRVQKLEGEKARIEQENLQLMAEIAELQSVDRLVNRARELGFVLAAVQEAEFLAVVDTPLGPAYAMDTGPTATGWWNSVTSQFTAWAQDGER